MKYKSFKVDLTPTEFNLINDYCKLKNMSKATFLRICMKEKGLKDFDDSLNIDFKELNDLFTFNKTYKYNDYYIYIICDGTNYSSYLQLIGNGIIMFMFGCYCDDVDDFIRLVKNNIKDYISIYDERFNS